MEHFWKAYFYFTRTERNGIGLLLFILLLIWSSPYTLSWFSEEESIDFSLLEKSIAEFQERKEILAHTLDNPRDSLFFFDPNSATEAQLRALGLREKVVGNILRYRKKKGVFRKAEDFSKIFGLSQKKFEALKAYIRIDTPPPSRPRPAPRLTYSSSKRVEPPRNIDINQATEEEWQQLKGIGPYYSGKIVRFRNKLGGFYQIEQVGETYGLPDSTFQSVRKHLTLSPLLHRLDINQADEKRLSGHPYITRNLARAIVRYRDNHGPYEQVSQLKKIYILKAEVYKKIEPYLTVSVGEAH